ncbi:MAG TPA: ABC transporter ATP-binding protein [Acidimicrobiia bacterium]
MNADSAVELVDVTKHFADVVAVDHVFLDIDRGEFFSLLGPSGCGKTTTLRMIAGLEFPSSGTIRLLGEDISDLPVHRRDTNMVFQNYALFPHLTVFENVAFGLEVRRVPKVETRERVRTMLDLVRLSGMERRKPRQLSGGQQQRVALARALIMDPPVLLLDEPLGALDQKLRKEMQLELKHIQREVGITFVYVTHDQEEALTMSDRIAVMNGGRVLQVDQPSALYDRPASRFVADFIGTSNFLTGRVVGGGAESLEIEVPQVGRIHVSGSSPADPGQSVTVSVRPERIRLGPSGTGNTARGLLDEVVFVGNDTLFLVRLGNGQQLQVREQNQGPVAQTNARRPGSEVDVAWSPASTTLLSD